MEQLFQSVLNFLTAGWEVVVSLLAVVAPWSPLIAWIAFWLLAVNWEKLYLVSTKGAIIGVALIAVMMILTWGLIAPPARGFREILGLKIDNFVEKTIYVTMLLTIAMACGSVQLSGACGSLVQFPDEDEHDGGHGHDSGHSDHDDHGHSSHAH